MSKFWEGFFSIFSFGYSPKTNLHEKYKPKEFNWYEPVNNWWEHSAWNGIWDKDQSKD